MSLDLPLAKISLCYAVHHGAAHTCLLFTLRDEPKIYPERRHLPETNARQPKSRRNTERGGWSKRNIGRGRGKEVLEKRQRGVGKEADERGVEKDAVIKGSKKRMVRYGKKDSGKKERTAGNEVVEKERSTNRNEEKERQRCLKGREKEKQGYGKRRNRQRQECEKRRRNYSKRGIFEEA